MTALLHLIILAAVIFGVATMLPAVHIRKPVTALVVAVVYSLVNFLIGWLLRFVSLPLTFLTFGLFNFVINAVLLWITDKLIRDFKIDGFGWTLVAAVLISLGNTLGRALLGV